MVKLLNLSFTTQVWILVALLSSAACAEHQGCPNSIENSYECAQYLERGVITKSDSKLLLRDEKSLIVFLRNGAKRIYKDAGEGTDVKRFSVVQHLKETEHVVIHIQYWENDSHLLLDLRTGKEYQIDGNPTLSPDSKRIAVIRMDDVAGRNPNSVAIFRFVDGNLVQEYRLTPDWGPSNLRWLSSNKIILVKNIIDTSTGAYKVIKREEYLLLRGTKWQLVQEPR